MKLNRGYILLLVLICVGLTAFPQHDSMNLDLSKLQFAVAAEVNSGRGYFTSLSGEYNDVVRLQVIAGYATHNPTIIGFNSVEMNASYIGMGFTVYKYGFVTQRGFPGQPSGARYSTEMPVNRDEPNFKSRFGTRVLYAQGISDFRYSTRKVETTGDNVKFSFIYIGGLWDMKFFDKVGLGYHLGISNSSQKALKGNEQLAFAPLIGDTRHDMIFGFNMAIYSSVELRYIF